MPGLHTTQAQSPAAKFKVDAVTYRFYLEQKWDSLLTEGKKGLHDGIDFYYLRMRMGIACYNTQKYATAILHFRKALQFVPEDTIALQYLYYANLYLKRDLEARFVASKLPASVQEKMDIRTSFVAGISTDYTFRRFEPEPYSLQITDNSTGIQQIPEQLGNFNFSVKQFAGNRVQILHSFTYLNQQNTYYWKTSSKEYQSSASLNQVQYYASISLRPRHEFITSFWGHFLFVNFPYLYEKSNGWSKVAYTGETDYLFGASLEKQFRFFSFDYEYNRARFNNLNYQQHTFQGSLYPLGNLNLYATYRLHFQQEIQQKEVHRIQQGLFGFKVTSKWWSEFQMTYGTMLNFADSHGYIVYNQKNPYTRQASVVWYFLLHSDWIISIRGSYIQGESQFNTSGILLNPVNFSSYSITGGLSWKF